MDKRGLSTGEIVLLFITLIVGLALIPAIFNEQSTLTTKQTAGSELLDISSLRNNTGGMDGNTSALNLVNKPAVGDWQGEGGCPLSGFILMNASYDSMTLNTDYVVDTTYFNVTYNKSADTSYGLIGAINNTYANYTYCQDGYNTGSGARGVARIIGLFTVLALVAAAIFYGAKEWLK